MVKKICILMLAMSRAGKTTKVATLSSVPERISRVCIKSDATTPVTTDWELSATATDVKLIKVELNPKIVYKDLYSRTVAKYNACLEETPFLTEFFGLEKIAEDAEVEDPKDYVEEQLKVFVENATFETVEKIMSNKGIGNFIKRITILVPACDKFKMTLQELNLDSVVLRDTRGIMDVKPEELSKLPKMSMYDLGLDGIDAVLLLCSTEEFPVQAGDWYKNIYRNCFESVPVFLECKTDALLSSYFTYSDIVEITPEEYMEKVKEEKVKPLNEMKDTFFESGFNLLRTYGAAARNYRDEWYFKYDVFDVKDCLYLMAVVPSLKRAARDGHITNDTFDNDSYKFFRDVTLYNMSNITKRVKEHLDLIDRITKQGVFDGEIIKFIMQYYANKSVVMYPDYRYISRQEVCSNIVNTNDFLGPLDGITTKNHGKPKYLAALTAAVTSHTIIYQMINDFRLKDTIKDVAGTEIAPDVSLQRQNLLVHMYLSKKLNNAADKYAYYNDYVITNRYTVVRALRISRENNRYVTGRDPLTIVTEEIAELIFH